MALEANLSFEWALATAATTAEQEMGALEMADAAAAAEASLSYEFPGAITAGKIDDATTTAAAEVSDSATVQPALQDNTSASPKNWVEAEHNITDAEYLALYAEQAERLQGIEAEASASPKNWVEAEHNITDAEYLALYAEQAERLQGMEAEAEEAYATGQHFISKSTTPAKVLLYQEGRRCYKYTPHTLSNVAGFKATVIEHASKYT